MDGLRRLLLATCALLSLGSAVAASLTPAEAMRKAEAEAGMQQIEADRQALMTRLYQSEQTCLQRFISAPCLEDLRQEAARENRVLDLAKESLLQSIRTLEAGARQRSRDQRLEASRAQ